MIVMLGLLVLTCNVGPSDNNNLMAFDNSYQSDNTQIFTLFYKTIFELDEETACLRLLRMTLQLRNHEPIFAGSAIGI